MPSSYGGQLFESRLDGYLSSVKAYMTAGESTENAMELAQTAVSQQVKAELKNFNNKGGTGMPAIFSVSCIRYAFHAHCYPLPRYTDAKQKGRSRTHNVFKPDVSKLQQTDGSWGKYLGV